MNLTGPFYTIQEALELLGMLRSELVHAVNKQEIQLVAYTQPRDLLLFRLSDAKEWVGSACILYRGHMTLHISYFQSLLEGQAIKVGQGWGRLLDETGMQRWRSEYPYKRELPHGPLSDWKAGMPEDTPLYNYCATPLPKEYEPLGDQILKTVASVVAARQDKAPQNTVPLEKTLAGLKLDFNERSAFEPACMRVPASEIERYLNAKKQKAAELKAQKAIEAENALKTGERENQLHTLIGRIIQKHPAVGAKQAWAILRHDANADEKVFDTDEILLLVDQDGLEWRSKYDEQQSLKYKSFAATLSKIKRRINQ